MTGNSKIAVFNNSSKIRTLKGETITKVKGSIDPKRFKSHLQPGVMNMIPLAYWAIYKRQKIVQAWLAQGVLVAGKDADIKKKKEDAETLEQFDAKAAEEAATIAQLESEG